MVGVFFKVFRGEQLALFAEQAPSKAQHLLWNCPALGRGNSKGFFLLNKQQGGSRWHVRCPGFANACYGSMSQGTLRCASELRASGGDAVVGVRKARRVCGEDVLRCS